MTENQEPVLTTKMYISIFSRMIFMPPALMLMLHWPARDWRWLDAWLFIIALTVVSFTALFWLMRSNPEMLAERLRGTFAEGQSKKDSFIVSVLSLFMLAIFPVAGFEAYEKWFTTGLAYRITGWVLLLLSLYLLYVVFKTNAYLSRSIVIQEERGQQVVDTGIYGIVRHPMYSATMVMTIGIVMLLGSVVALVPAFISFIFLYWRAISEEDLLEKELEGYTEYKQKVRKRMIPFVI